MLVREVGEGRRRQLEPIEPVLVEAVARRLDREMRHALAGQRGDILVELHRIGRREAALAHQAGRHDAERADARRLEAQGRPDVAHEVHGRGLAVGAGDGGDGRRLQASEGRRHQRHAPPRIAVAQHDDRRIERRQRRVGRSEDGDGAAPHGVGDEGGAVLARAGQGGEEIARLDLARVEGQAGKEGIARKRRGGCCAIGAAAHELTQSQSRVLPDQALQPSARGPGGPARPCDGRPEHGAR